MSVCAVKVLSLRVLPRVALFLNSVVLSRSFPSRVVTSFDVFAVSRRRVTEPSAFFVTCAFFCFWSCCTSLGSSLPVSFFATSAFCFVTR